MAKNPLTVAAARNFRRPVEDLLECVEKALKAGTANAVKEQDRTQLREIGLPLLRKFCGEPHRIYQGFEQSTRTNDIDDLKTARGILRALKMKIDRELEKP